MRGLVQKVEKRPPIKMYDSDFFFRTSDLALATAISVLGVAIEAMQQTDSERMNFIFAKSEKLTDIVKKYEDHAFGRFGVTGIKLKGSAIAEEGPTYSDLGEFEF